jgi:hypothetical protein
MLIRIFSKYKTKKKLAIKSIFRYIVKKFINPTTGGIVYEALF